VTKKDPIETDLWVSIGLDYIKYTKTIGAKGICREAAEDKNRWQVLYLTAWF